jgi:DNA-binding NtrC family response regulator
MANILVVDDEVGIRELLSEILQDEGHTIWLAANATDARELRACKRPDLVLLDIWMPDTDGISLLKEWAAAGLLNMPVVMMSGHGTIDTAVEATRIGAVDFLEKPIALQKLLATVKKAMKHDRPVTRTALTLDDFAKVKCLRDLKRRLEQAIDRMPAVLLKGASGWMAELCARSLHVPSTAWIDLSANGSPLTQESLQQAAGGLLFVGDLAALGRLQQMNLAFALERLAKYNLRLVTATAQPMNKLQESGWDAGVLARLSEVWVPLPPLAAHADDVPEIAAVFLARHIELGEVPPRRFTSGALNALRLHGWVGDWGELQAVVRNLGLTALNEEIDGDDVAELLGAGVAEALMPSLLPLMDLPLREARDAFERLYFEHHLRQEGGNMSRLAEQIGVERTHLYRKLKQLGVGGARRNDGLDDSVDGAETAGTPAAQR